MFDFMDRHYLNASKQVDGALHPKTLQSSIFNPAPLSINPLRNREAPVLGSKSYHL